jgi:hypothetical protein
MINKKKKRKHQTKKSSGRVGANFIGTDSVWNVL